jgi:hypothetical protein
VVFSWLCTKIGFLWNSVKDKITSVLPGAKQKDIKTQAIAKGYTDAQADDISETYIKNWWFADAIGSVPFVGQFFESKIRSNNDADLVTKLSNVNPGLPGLTSPMTTEANSITWPWN